MLFVGAGSFTDSFAGSGIGSGSSGAGGGVVSIVQPIHPEITRTSRTNTRTGMPTASSCHPVGVDGLYILRPGIQGAKKAVRYTIATIMDMMKMTKPYPWSLLMYFTIAG